MSEVFQPELSGIVTLVARWIQNESLRHFLLQWVDIVYAILAAFFIIIVFWLVGKKKALIPDRLQNFAELIIGGLVGLILGENLFIFSSSCHNFFSTRKNSIWGLAGKTGFTA